MNCSIRLEEESDYRAVENITREAFWDLYRPGCVEHLLVHKIRTVSAFVQELDFVACLQSRVVGNIMYSKARIMPDERASFEVLCLGPVTVLPEFQKIGIGSRLITESLKRAGQLGYKGVFLMGNPAYYSRFGFRDAKVFQVQTSEGKNFEYFMGLELYKDSLAGIHGRYFEDEVFKIDNAELEEFEKSFPVREKHKTDTQLW